MPSLKMTPISQFPGSRTYIAMMLTVACTSSYSSLTACKPMPEYSLRTLALQIFWPSQSLNYPSPTGRLYLIPSAGGSPASQPIRHNKWSLKSMLDMHSLNNGQPWECALSPCDILILHQWVHLQRPLCEAPEMCWQHNCSTVHIALFMMVMSQRADMRWNSWLSVLAKTTPG